MTVIKHGCKLMYQQWKIRRLHHIHMKVKTIFKSINYEFSKSQNNTIQIYGQWTPISDCCSNLSNLHSIKQTCVYVKDSFTYVTRTHTIDSKSQSITLTVKWAEQERECKYVVWHLWFNNAFVYIVKWCAMNFNTRICTRKSNQIKNNVNLGVYIDFFRSSSYYLLKKFSIKEYKPHLNTNKTYVLSVFFCMFQHDFCPNFNLKKNAAG